jgi:peptide/nickel transport system ATP-binding protein
VVMYAGELVEQGTSEEVIFDPIHPYTRALMGSIIVPEDGMKTQKLTAIPGAPPNLKNVPPGCRFYDRCAYAHDKCKEQARIPATHFGAEDSRYHRCVLSEQDLRERYEMERRQFAIGGARK